MRRGSCIPLVALLLLAGCSGPDGARAPEAGDPELAPLPEPIHDERDVVVTASAGQSSTLPCTEAHHCVDHPFTLTRAAHVAATVSWGVAGNQPWLIMYQDGEQLNSVVPAPGATATTMHLNVKLEAGEYLLRLDAVFSVSDHWVLDVTFSDGPTEPGFLVSTLPITTCPCLEPSIAVDDDGILYAITSFTIAEIAVSSDGGRSWQTFDPPAVPAGAAYQTDALLHMAPSGRLYFSAMIARDAGIIDGIQIAWSDDRARSWESTYLSFTQGRPEMIGLDRQWLAFGAGADLHLTFLQQPVGIWHVRSSDGGKTWGPGRQVIGAESPGNSGPLVIDADGRIHIPKCTPAGGGLMSDKRGPFSFDVFTSSDDGVSWTRTPVSSAGCAYYPILAIAPDGTLGAAWHDHEDGKAPVTRGAVQVAFSVDHAATWTSPSSWGGDTLTAPWILPAVTGFDVVWLREEPDQASSRGVVSQGAPEEPARITAELPVFFHGSDRHSPQSTDFAHAARLPDGGIALVWTDQHSVTVAVQEP